jgi:hypothetical protein
VLNTDQLVTKALEVANASAFSDLRFLPPLESLIEGLNTEAALNEIGRQFHAARLIDLLANRLRLEQWIERYPEILEEEILSPIVVIGLPRTGTTMLHRSIAADDQLLAPLWYEVRQPSPLNDDFEQEDDRIPIAQAEVAAMLEASPELAAIHPMDPVAADEEIMLLEHAFMSTVPECYGFMPKYGDNLYNQDQSAGYNYLYLQLQFLQWQKRRKGLTGKRWLLKTPHHLHYPEHLFARFPDAVVIQTHRHPLEVIPSYGSMMSALASPFTDKLDPVAMAQHWANKWQVGLAKTREFRDNGHDHHYLDLWFQDSVSDPEATIRRIYEFTGQTLTEGALTEMARWRDMNARENRPEHHYQLADYGFTAAGIQDQFGEYISRHAAR